VRQRSQTKALIPKKIAGMDTKAYRLDLNWQTRLALDWLIRDPETAVYWRGIARAKDISALTHDLTMSMVEEASALPVSWARDAAMRSLPQIEWRELAHAVSAR
jgi:hypothetical protein